MNGGLAKAAVLACSGPGSGLKRSKTLFCNVLAAILVQVVFTNKFEEIGCCNCNYTFDYVITEKSRCWL